MLTRQSNCLFLTLHIFGGFIFVNHAINAHSINSMRTFTSSKIHDAIYNYNVFINNHKFPNKINYSITFPPIAFTLAFNFCSQLKN